MSPGDRSADRRRVEIVHESLLTNWPRLVRWRTQDEEGAQLRDELRQAAQVWDQHGRAEDFLWTGTAFREYQLWHERYPGGLTALEEAFAAAMTTLVTKRLRRRRAIVVAAFLVVLVGATIVAWQGRRERRARWRAEASRLFGLAQLEMEADPTKALAYATASLALADSPEVRRFALEALLRQPLYSTLESREGGDNTANVAFSPDGRWLAVRHLITGKISLFASEGGPPRILNVGRHHYYSFRFSAQSDRLLTSAANAVQVWSIPEGTLLRSLEYGSAEDLHRPLSADSSTLFTASYHDSGARVLSWSEGDSAPVTVGEVEDLDSQLEVDSAEDLVAYIAGGEIFLRPLDSFSSAVPREVGRHEHALVLALDPAGRWLASGDEMGGIRIWSLDARADGPLVVLDGREPVHSLGFDPTGTRLASGHAGGAIRIWELESPLGTAPLELLGHPDSVFAVAFDPSGRWLATAHRNSYATLWPLDRNYPRTLVRLQGGTVYTLGVVFAPDTSWIAAALGKPVLRRWSLAGARAQPSDVQLSGEGIALAADPAGRHVLAGTVTGVELVSVLDGSARKLRGFSGKVGAVALHRDGRLAAAGGGFADDTPSENFVRVWDLDAGTHRDLATSGGVFWLDFLPDSRLLYVAGTLLGEKNLYRWSAGQDRAELLMPRIAGDDIWSHFDLSRDGGQLLVRTSATEESERTIDLRDLETGTVRRIAAAGGPASAKLGANGALVVYGTEDGRVRVVSLAGGATHDLVGHKGRVNEVLLSTDARWIASAGWDGTLRLWPMPDLSKPPLHTLPYDDLLTKLRSLTNLRVVADATSPTGYKLDVGPFPGWETVPEW